MTSRGQGRIHHRRREGQGRSHALRLAAEGADIIAVDTFAAIDTVPYPLATAEQLAETAAAVELLDRRIVAQDADVRDLGALTGSSAARSPASRMSSTPAAVSDGFGGGVEVGRDDRTEVYGEPQDHVLEAAEAG